MFREMRRSRQEVSREECVCVLNTAKRGVLSVIGDDGYPYGVPVNFYYDEAEERIYFHSAKEGHKIDSIKGCDKVCFTVWDNGFKRDGDWAWYVTSVIAMGRAELAEGAEEKLRRLGVKYYPDEREVDAVMERHANKVQMIAMKIENMRGKLVHEK